MVNNSLTGYAGVGERSDSALFTICFLLFAFLFSVADLFLFFFVPSRLGGKINQPRSKAIDKIPESQKISQSLYSLFQNNLSILRTTHYARRTTNFNQTRISAQL